MNQKRVVSVSCFFFRIPMFMNICERFPYPYEYVYFTCSYLGRIILDGNVCYTRTQHFLERILPLLPCILIKKNQECSLKLNVLLNVMKRINYFSFLYFTVHMLSIQGRPKEVRCKLKNIYFAMYSCVTSQG